MNGGVRHAGLGGVLAVAALLAPAAAPGQGPAIDRRALVTRRNVTLERYDAATPFQVGNGAFAFGVDATGLQTFIRGGRADEPRARVPGGRELGGEVGRTEEGALSRNGNRAKSRAANVETA